MPRVTHVKKARKDILGTDIKAGEEYYHWHFRFGPKCYSKTPPKRGQLTRSAFYQTLWDIEDNAISALQANDGLKDAVEDIAQQLRDLGEECQGSLDNMPESLQQGSTGQMLQERIEGLEAAADEFDNIDFDDREESETDDEFYERKLEEAQQISIDVP